MEWKITLKAARATADMSQAEAAKAAKICRNTLNGYERGRHKPSDAMVRRLAEIYGVPRQRIDA